MNVKFVALVCVLIFITILQKVDADFYFNHPRPKNDKDLAIAKLKCIPGRTVIKIKDKVVEESLETEEEDFRRTHMTHQTDDETCQICVCSLEGKDEYCSKRPAKNVNECIRIGSLMDSFQKNMPYDHERSLSWRMRRDFLWHNDEIPYDSKAKCRRGHAYYSNSVNANDTDIDVSSEVESLLDYSNKHICFYCICSVDGHGVRCISRKPWFCEQYRYWRENDTPRDMYAKLFKQDRPTYFRQLSYRIRRTMDDGLFDLVDQSNGGDTLCCGHPDGHRRNLHNTVRQKIKLLKRRVPKENLLTGGPKVGGDSVNKVGQEKCVPFVSQYSDCTEGENCNDCTVCTCNAESKWECNSANSCADVFKFPPKDELSLQQAFNMLESEMEDHSKAKETKKPDHLVPTPEDDAIHDKPNDSIEDDLKAILRIKRSTKEIVGDEKKNKTDDLYHSLNDGNEGTLNNNNTKGTLMANKMELGFKISRRTDVSAQNNTNSLQIEHKKPIHHITDNKLDENVQIDHDINEKIHKVIGNTLTKEKDKKISKLIVNELKPGIELIGDNKSTIMSNVTFASENDTLVAVAYIAGNLLNKLWNIEKDASSESFESEVLKHEKITELVELFKEPLSLRQETFLKNALEQLSSAVKKNGDTNLNICESITTNNPTIETHEENRSVKKNCNNLRKTDKKENVSKEAVDKIMNVLNLIKKFEQVQKNLTTINHEAVTKDTKNVALESKLDHLSQDETASLNVFGGVLEKITKLLMPKKSRNKMANKIKYQNIFSHPDDFKKKFKTLYNLDLSNITISIKDKLIMDYLTHIEKNPDCLLNEKSHRHETKSVPQLEGDVLLNLSEFFKVKSYADILQILDNQRRSEPVKKPAHRTSKFSESIKSTTTEVVTEKITTNDEKVALAKENLKNHLKMVLEDLVALKNATDGSNSTKIKITDALPCLYNLLNTDKEKSTKTSDRSLKNVKAIFDYLKNEIQLPPFRRSNIKRQRPKSAVVWERVVKNLNNKVNLKTRRNMEVNKPKSYDEIKEMIEKNESFGSNTYKSVALLSEVPAADKLTLLKTLNTDVNKYLKILEDMKTSLTSNLQVPNKYLKDFTEFIDNAAMNINVNERIVKHVNKPKYKNTIIDKVEYDMRQNKGVSNEKPLGHIETEFKTKSDDNIRLTRDQIINHLMKNRIRVYLKAKEADEFYNNEDINYRLAKKILLYLDQGNVSLARELFKIFAANKQKDSKRVIAPPPLLERHPSTVNKVPLIQFDDTFTPSTNDLLFKQLQNIKNMSR